MARILMVVMSVILMGCASGTPINDFSTRSVVYGWLDIGQVSGNRLVGVSIRNTRTGAEEQYYDIGWEKLDGGYLIWHNGVQPGQYEFNKIQTMACLGVMCGNTINEYEFGALGSAPRQGDGAVARRLFHGEIHAQDHPSRVLPSRRV
ncbi:MAG: hypothetical protein HKO95_06280 [Rhodobacteraceae bacterium]|nr:hypothetical protein [Alphaproteobacteria bacterium]NNK66327.1 hypothetical protein [Paracoccaceae bacterium]